MAATNTLFYWGLWLGIVLCSSFGVPLTSLVTSQTDQAFDQQQLHDLDNVTSSSWNNTWSNFTDVGTTPGDLGIVGRNSTDDATNTTTNSLMPSTDPTTTIGDSGNATTISAGSGVCQASPCLNGGVCQPQGGSSFSCMCADFYSGALCDQGGPCTSQPCQNGGVCVNNGNSNRCICPNTHTCPNCENPTSGGTSLPSPTASSSGPSSNGITSTVSQACGQMLTKDDIGCGDADIVFLVEHSSLDTGSSIDHQGDTVMELIDLWEDQDRSIRVGVVAYNDQVDNILHLTDVNSHKSQTKNKIQSYTDTIHRPHNHDLHASGEANLAKVLDFVKDNNVFDDSRPGVPKVVIPIIHQMPTYDRARQNIVAAGQDLVGECVSIVALLVRNHGELHDDTVTQMVQQPTGGSSSGDDFVLEFSSYQYLEDQADDRKLFNCRHH